MLCHVGKNWPRPSTQKETAMTKDSVVRLTDYETRLTLEKETLLTLIDQSETSAQVSTNAEQPKVASRSRLSETLEYYREKLRQVEHAIAKIRTNRFGVCEECGSPIPESRLIYRPFAVHCISCQRNREKSSRPEDADTESGAEEPEFWPYLATVKS